MKYKLDNNNLIIYLSGRIDSTNANSVDLEIDSIRNDNSHTSLTLDLDTLEYISSAGLRIVLKLLKQEKDLKLINVSVDVYEIFEMTGFTEMATIEKAYRKVSVENCEVIGEGANGKVYRLDPETIVKVYINEDSLPDIKRERDLARKAFVLGVPTAIPYDVIKTNEGYGSVFELLESKSLAKQIKNDPEKVDKCIDMSVNLLKQIHGTLIKEGDMPSMLDVVKDWSVFMKDYLPASSYEKLEKLINTIPEDHHMLHGDYHVKNIMVQNDEPVLIDMDTICYGYPICEFAGMYNAYVGFSIYTDVDTQKFLDIPGSTALYIWNESLKRYFNTTDETFLRSVEKKAKLIGFIRIARRSIRRGFLEDPIKKEWVNNYINDIIKLVDEIDTLVI